MSKADPRQQLQPVATALQEALGDDLLALVLFGSRARGEANPESDWDLLLLAENLPPSPWRRAQQMRTLLPREWRHRVSILAHTPAEIVTRIERLIEEVGDE